MNVQTALSYVKMQNTLRFWLSDLNAKFKKKSKIFKTSHMQILVCWLKKLHP